ncbi:Uncharacterised protein [Aerococcus viridans]|uniref:DUF5067 domain-containing protein n=2 Tax=Aerococcus viridans TaxID=1377 RepID=A0AAU8U6V0_9LACT|nr:DUF5067 domain-containing protein [Aerococcus viridans]AMC01203.1 hypothetical protein AWM76_06415 [Aerococcus viridans]EFG50442.1 hypothetical protein HMPREF0061_0218 [Aerococcus viridans ATCC 11563 = CCUG 4311]SUU16896.1 Uncharacterised protein [Aerococcus viridans]
MKKLVLVGLSVFALAACGANESESAEESSTSTSQEVSVSEESSTESVAPEETTSSEWTFDGTVAEIEDVKVEITDYHVIPIGEPGNEYGESPVIAFWYDATNKSGDDINAMSAWMAIFTAVQDNDPNVINELEVASLPDEQYLDSQMETIKEGGTVSNAWGYYLTDETTPVTLIATQGIMGEEIGQHNFEIAE